MVHLFNLLEDNIEGLTAELRTDFNRDDIDRVSGNLYRDCVDAFTDLLVTGQTDTWQKCLDTLIAVEADVRRAIDLPLAVIRAVTRTVVLDYDNERTLRTVEDVGCRMTMLLVSSYQKRERVE